MITERRRKEVVRHAGALLVRPTTVFLREHPPGNAGCEGRRQCRDARAIREARSPTFWPSSWSRQERFDRNPQCICSEVVLRALSQCGRVSCPRTRFAAVDRFKTGRVKLHWSSLNTDLCAFERTRARTMYPIMYPPSVREGVMQYENAIVSDRPSRPVSIASTRAVRFGPESSRRSC